MKFVKGITFRFTIWYLVVIGVLLVILSAGVYSNLSRSLYRNLDHSLELRAAELNNVIGILTNIRQGNFQEELGEVVLLYFYSGDRLIKVSARDTEIPQDSQLVEQALAGNSSFATIETVEGQRMRLYAVPFSPDRSDIVPRGPSIQPAVLVIGRSTTEIEEALERLMHTLIIAVPLTMALAGGSGVFLAKRALKPVEHITQTAGEIEESDLSRRIKVHTEDELGRLASTLNQMIDRLEQAFSRQRQFTADASHELRTPLAVIQAESTLALQKERTASDYQASLEAISQEVTHMSAIIDKLLILARADAGKERLAFERVNLGELLHDLASDVKTLCQEKGIQFQLGQMENLIIKGDKASLNGMLLNLLDNAIRYTPNGGTVSVSLAREGQIATVAIKDTGIGIPPEHIPHIFERFYRADKARSRTEGGSGLGLAICQHIAEVHRGKIEVESQVGEGSTFSVSLPLLEQA
jgi:heavy metal sensor kinase